MRDNRPAPPRDAAGTPAAAMLAAAIALLGSAALATDFAIAVPHALAAGRGIATAVLDWARFFTIQSNAGLVALMGATALARWRGRPPPPAALYRAAVVYMSVTCITYELLLRGTWSPHGALFVADLAFHDVQPALTLIFWLGFAPQPGQGWQGQGWRGQGWRDPGWRGVPWLLAYPAAYFALTLLAGRLGAGYPYDFLDPRRFGAGGVAAIAAAFLAVFLVLGGLATLAAGRLRA